MLSTAESLVQVFHRVAQVTRASLYETPDDPQLPLNLQSDARIPFLGFCGPRYENRGVVVLAINPGGGGNSYTSRTPQDSALIPLIEKFASAPSASTSAFETMCESYSAQVQTWNLWRILRPTLEASGTTLEHACYLNIFPYRTERDVRPSSQALVNAWQKVVSPLLEVLDPSLIVALGKKAGSVADRFHRPPPTLFVVPRTIGDSYVSAEAERVLASIRDRAV